MMTPAEQIARHMKANGITRTSLAMHLRVTPAAVTKALRRESNLTVESLRRYSDALGLNLTVVIEGPRFLCPMCGGRRWGTSNATGPRDEWIGHCHSAGCRFTWKRTKAGDEAVGLRECKVPQHAKATT